MSKLKRTSWSLTLFFVTVATAFGIFASGVAAVGSTFNPSQVNLGSGLNPYQAAASPDGQYVYMTSILNTGKLFQIKISDNSVRSVSTLANSGQGLAVSPDSTKIYVSYVNADKIDVFDSVTMSLIATWNLTSGTGPFGLALSGDGSQLYIAGYYSNTVVKVNTSSGNATYFATGNGPFSVALNSGGTMVYSSNNGAGTVSVINTSSGTLVSTVTVGSAPFGLATTLDGTRLLVANENSNSISVVDLATNTVSATISSLSQPRFLAVSPDGSTLAASTVNNNSVTLADLTSLQVTQVLPVPGPGFAQGVAFGANGGSMWAAATNVGNASRWDINPPLYTPTPTPTPTPSSTTAPTLSSTGLDAAPYFLIAGALMGGGVFALAIAILLRRRSPNNSQ